ncbi:MAG: hypothetical protein HYU41_01140 [Candidatus Rokubacteria bacterium]|nr:hypothetical protein [Candidatus Rokubacteria bacterium]
MDRTLAAIQRIVPAHVQELSRFPGWETTVETGADRLVLTVTSAGPEQVAHIRGLGFVGLLASRTQHEPRHLATARRG